MTGVNYGCQAKKSRRNESKFGTASRSHAATLTPGVLTTQRVGYIRHAVSIDERRAYFPQNMWTGTSTHQDAIKQVWFPGVHCDVGGGYKEFEEAGLSKGALHW